MIVFNARNTKFANFTGLYFLHFTTFISNQSLQFYSLTLFLAVVLDFVLLALIKIYSIAGITHSCKTVLNTNISSIPLSFSIFLVLQV